MLARERGPCGEIQGCKPVMNEHGKSDRPIVPGKRPNKGARAPAEAVEGRGLAKGNPLPGNTSQTQRWLIGVRSDRERVRQASA